MNANLKDDYTQMLPIFPFPNLHNGVTSAADMDKAIKKGTKTIAYHSITAKPDYKKGSMTKSEKEFYNKREYNNWVDDAYLLIGKASLMKGDIVAADEAFRKIIKDFPEEKTFPEAKIYLARTLILKEEYIEAQDILTQLEADQKLPGKFKSFLNATFADFYIHKKLLNEAIPYLEEASKKVHDKQSRLRYTFILGQLYQATGQLSKATEKYLKVISMSPPYEMTFNARINLAGSFESGNQNADEIRKNLYKLLHDSKNKEYQDQIYYALANIDYKEGNIDKAIENYKLSASKSVSNPKQKGKSFLAIADIKYNAKDYLNAQTYYDSAVINLDENFPDFARIDSRSKCLTRLAKNLNTVTFQDSVQFVAKMSESERNMFIDNIIAKLKEKEAEEQRQKQEELLALQNSGNYDNDMNQNGNQGEEGAKWYFYNPSSKSFGESDFKLKWGNRKLEDNWRRSNKKSVSAESNSDETAETEDDNTKKKTLSNKTREFYMQNLPLTDSAMDASHAKIKKALFDAATIFKDELNELQLSADEFNQIIKRYPDDPLVASADYEQYILYRQLNNNSKAEEFKSLLLNKFPESVYAKLLRNPNFLKELTEQENAVGKLYESAYDDFNNGNETSALNKVNKGLSEYPNHKLTPKFLFLKALISGKQMGIDSLHTELNKLVKIYPKTEEAGAARDIIAMMDVKHPEVKEAEEKAIAKEIYKPVDENETHYYVIVVNPKKGNYNQLVFNLINYNLDNYSNITLSTKAEIIGGTNQMVIVRDFKSKNEALNYFDAAQKDESILKDVGSGVLATFIISKTNFDVFKQDGIESRYMKYFKDNYNR
jgi:tetratricopeptide (TPR) repeat protein